MGLLLCNKYISTSTGSREQPMVPSNCELELFTEWYPVWWAGPAKIIRVLWRDPCVLFSYLCSIIAAWLTYEYKCSISVICRPSTCRQSPVVFSEKYFTRWRTDTCRCLEREYVQSTRVLVLSRVTPCTCRCVFFCQILATNHLDLDFEILIESYLRYCRNT